MLLVFTIYSNINPCITANPNGSNTSIALLGLWSFLFSLILYALFIPARYNYLL